MFYKLEARSKPDVRVSQDVIHVHNKLNTSRSHFEIDGHSINK